MKQLHPNIHLLALGSVNAYLIDEGQELILIDTGYKDSEKAIRQYIEKIGRQVSDLKHIIVTHHHPDHAGSLAALKARTNAKIYMHPKDAQLVEHGIGMRKEVVAGPGHSEGQVALLFDDHGDFLFGADTATNLLGLSHPPLYENTKQGYDDLARIASLKFEGAAFGHGQPILKGADQKFVKKYGKNH